MRVAIRGFAVVAMAAAGFAGLTSMPRASAQTAATTYQYHPATASGVVAPAGSNRVRATSSANGDARVRGVRTPQHGSAGSGAPAVSSNSATAAHTLLHNWNGVSSLDSQQTNYNAEFEPPDQGLCEGNGFVLEAVNSAYSFWHTNGQKIEGPFNVNDLFNEGGEEFTSDPRCHFDPTTNTWFATILFISADGSSSHLDIAVNNTGDPTNFWTEYRIDTTDAGGNGCPCFGDQPRIGIDQNNIYVTSDEFSISGPQYDGGQIFAFAKSDLVAGNAVHFVEYSNLGLAGQQVFGIEPAISTGSPSAAYFLNSMDLNGTSASSLGVWALTTPSIVASGGRPLLSSAIVQSEPYALPLNAPQKGATGLINAGDDRMQQAQYITGNVWAELDTALTPSGDSATRDGAAWFEVHPTVSGNHLGSISITAQGYVARSGEYLLYPALQVDGAGRGAMVFTDTSPNRYPSAAYTVLGAGSTTWGGPIIAASGSGPYDQNATRWGDYSWAVLDPSSGRFWLATEYVPPRSSWTSNGQRNWGTRVLEVQVTG